MEFTSIAALCQGMWSLHLKDLNWRCLNRNTSLSTVFMCFWRWQLLKQRQQIQGYTVGCSTTSSGQSSPSITEVQIGPDRSTIRDESLRCHQYFCRPRLSFTFTSCMVFTAGSMSESSRRWKDGEVPDQRGSGGRVWKWNRFSRSLPKWQFNLRSLS